MKTWTKIKLALALILVGFIFVSIIENLIRDDYVRITQVDYQAVVVDEEDSQGKVVISERLTFDVHAASSSNLFWELWRELPETYVDGVLVHYNVLSVKQILADGSEIVYPESPKLYWFDDDFTDTSGELGPGKWFHSEGPYDDYYNYESLIFYMDGLYRETVVFEIQYEMFNAVLRYGDVSELYLAMYSGPTSKYLTHFKGEVLIPSDKMPKSGNYDAYTYGTNSHEFLFTESDSKHAGYHTFAFELNQDQLKFKDYNEYIEFSLLAYNEDKHAFSQYASENYYYDDLVLAEIQQAQRDYENLPALYHKKKMNLLITTAILSLVAFVLTFFVTKNYRRKYKLFKPTQVIDYFRDIPSELDANFARMLVFSKSASAKVDADGYAAAMLSLINKGYLTLTTKDRSKKESPNNMMVEVQSSDQPLSLIERQYFNLIERHAQQSPISLGQLQRKVSTDYEYTHAFNERIKTALNQIGVNEGYFQNANYQKPKNSMIVLGVISLIVSFFIMLIGNLVILNTRYDLAFGAFFVLGVSLILIGIYWFKTSKKYILLSQFGQDEYEKWHGLYRFLNNETLMVERGVQDLVLWEQYLIYATAFGISSKVIKALKMVLPAEAINNSRVLHNYRIYNTRSFRSTTQSFSSATRMASTTVRSGSHSSGFGGGGRGGGGGGGGH